MLYIENQWTSGKGKLFKSINPLKGEIVWDSTKPDGTPRKLMDNSKLEVQGWSSSIELKKGIKLTYQWFKDSQSKIREVRI